ncbi:hypothetical protein L195_g051411, partial [Trifolium pratense]
MYEKSFGEKEQQKLSKTKWELEEEKLKIDFDQTIVDESNIEDIEVTSDEKIIR